MHFFQRLNALTQFVEQNIRKNSKYRAAINAAPFLTTFNLHSLTQLFVESPSAGIYRKKSFMHSVHSHTRSVWRKKSQCTCMRLGKLSS